MKKFVVEFSYAAEDELIESIVWGIENWGEQEAFRWARQFRSETQRKLAVFPLGLSRAPEREDSVFDIRQLIIGRYRVLFVVNEEIVTILGIRGPYSEQK